MIKTSNWTIGKKVGMGVGGMCAMVLVLTGVAFMGLRSVGEEFEAAANQDAIKLDVADSIDTAGSEILSNQRGELVRFYMHDLKTAEKYHTLALDQAKQAEALLVRVQPLIVSEEGKRFHSSVSSVIQAIPSDEDKVWELGSGGHSDAAAKFYAEQTLPRIQQLNKLTGEWSQHERDDLAAGVEKGRGQIARSQWMSAGTVIVFLLIAASVMFMMFRSIAELKRMTVELHESEDQIASASTQVAGSSSSLASGASQQAASLEETSASVEEITSMTKKNAENSQVAARIDDATVEKLVKERQPHARTDGAVHARNQRVQRQDRQNHQSDRRDRLPDQYSGPERGGGSRARRRSGHGIRGGGRRSPQSGAALGAGGQGHRGADRGFDREIERRRREAAAGDRSDPRHHGKFREGEDAGG